MPMRGDMDGHLAPPADSELHLKTPPRGKSVSDGTPKIYHGFFVRPFVPHST